MICWLAVKCANTEQPVEGSAGLLPVEGSAGLLPVEGSAGLIPVEGSAGLIPVEGSAGLIPVEGSAGLIPVEGSAGLLPVEGSAGLWIWKVSWSWTHEAGSCAAAHEEQAEHHQLTHLHFPAGLCEMGEK
jgi:hypothetical protein